MNRNTNRLLGVMEADGLLSVGRASTGRQIKLLCPFHRDTEPSLVVRRERWRCYGCGRGGTLVDYLMHSRGVGIRQAMEMAGRSVPRKRPVSYRDVFYRLISNDVGEAEIGRFWESGSFLCSRDFVVMMARQRFPVWMGEAELKANMLRFQHGDRCGQMAGEHEWLPMLARRGNDRIDLESTLSSACARACLVAILRSIEDGWRS